MSFQREIQLLSKVVSKSNFKTHREMCQNTHTQVTSSFSCHEEVSSPLHVCLLEVQQCLLDHSRTECPLHPPKLVVVTG